MMGSAGSFCRDVWKNGLLLHNFAAGNWPEARRLGILVVCGSGSPFDRG